MSSSFAPGSLRRGRLVVALAALGLLAACASVPPPTNLVERADQQLQMATQAGAADAAPVDLGFARQRLQEAKAALQEKKNADARDRAEESLADGRLAQVRAQLAAARHQIRAQKTKNARARARLLGAPDNAPDNGGLPAQITLPPAQAPTPAPASSTAGGQA